MHGHCKRIISATCGLHDRSVGAFYFGGIILHVGDVAPRHLWDVYQGAVFSMGA